MENVPNPLDLYKANNIQKESNLDLKKILYAIKNNTEQFFTRNPIDDIEINDNTIWTNKIIIEHKNKGLETIDFTKLLYATNKIKNQDNSNNELYLALSNLKQQNLKDGINLITNSFKDGLLKNALVDQITKVNVQNCKSLDLEKHTRYDLISQLLCNITEQTQNLVNTIINEDNSGNLSAFYQDNSFDMYSLQSNIMKGLKINSSQSESSKLIIKANKYKELDYYNINKQPSILDKDTKIPSNYHKKAISNVIVTNSNQINDGQSSNFRENSEFDSISSVDMVSNHSISVKNADFDQYNFLAEKPTYTISVDLLNFINNQAILNLINSNDTLKIIPELIKISVFQAAFLTSSSDNLYSYIMSLLREFSNSVFKVPSTITNDQLDNEIQLGQFISECLNSQKEKVFANYLIEQIKLGAQHSYFTLDNLKSQAEALSKTVLNQQVQNWINKILKYNLGEVGKYYWEYIATKSTSLKNNIHNKMACPAAINRWINRCNDMFALVHSVLSKDPKKKQLPSMLPETLIHPGTTETLQEVVKHAPLTITVPLLKKLRLVAPLLDEYFQSVLNNQTVSFQKIFDRIMKKLSNKINSKNIHKFLPISKSNIEDLVKNSTQYPAQSINDISTILQIYYEAQNKMQDTIQPDNNITDTSIFTLDRTTSTINKYNLIEQFITTDNASVIFDFFMKNKDNFISEIDDIFYNYRKAIHPLTVYQLFNSLKAGSSISKELTYYEFIFALKNNKMRNLSFLYQNENINNLDWNPEWIIDYKDMCIWNKNQFKSSKTEAEGPKAVLNNSLISELWKPNVRRKVMHAIQGILDNQDYENNFYQNNNIPHNIKYLFFQYDLWDIATAMNEISSLISPNVLPNNLNINTNDLKIIMGKLNKINNILTLTDLMNYIKNDELVLLTDQLKIEIQQINMLKEQLASILPHQKPKDKNNLVNKQTEISKKSRDITDNIADINAPINCILNLYNSFWPKNRKVETFNINVADNTNSKSQLKIILDCKNHKVLIKRIGEENPLFSQFEDLVYSGWDINQKYGRNMFGYCNDIIEHLQVGAENLKELTDVLIPSLL